MGISTAGHQLESLLGGLYAYGKRVNAGEVEDPAFLFDWSEPSVPYTLPADLEAAVRDVYGDLLSFVNLAAVMAEFEKRPEYEFRRYFLNQWTATKDQWLPTGRWQDLEPGVLVDGERVVLGFDGSYNRDATAVVGCSIDPPFRIQVLGVWENTDETPGWVVPRGEVDACLIGAFDRFGVVELAADPYRWRRELDEWTDRWGDVIVEFNTASPKLSIPATTKFYDAVVNGDIAHDHDPTLARHLENCVLKHTGSGAYITKESRASLRRIDAAMAAVVAFDRATWRREYEEEHTPMVTFL